MLVLCAKVAIRSFLVFACKISVHLEDFVVFLMIFTKSLKMSSLSSSLEHHNAFHFNAFLTQTSNCGGETETAVTCVRAVKNLTDDSKKAKTVILCKYD